MKIRRVTIKPGETLFVDGGGFGLVIDASKGAIKYYDVEYVVVKGNGQKKTLENYASDLILKKKGTKPCLVPQVNQIRVWRHRAPRRS